MSDSKPTDGVTPPEADATATAPETATENLATENLAAENAAAESAAEHSAPEHSAPESPAAEDAAVETFAVEYATEEHPIAPAAASPREDSAESTDSAYSSANETKAYDTSALVAAAFESPEAPVAPAASTFESEPSEAAGASEPFAAPAPLVEPAAAGTAGAPTEVVESAHESLAASDAATAPEFAAASATTPAPAVTDANLPEPVAADSVKRETYIPAAVVGGVAAGAATLSASDAPTAYVPGAPTAATAATAAPAAAYAAPSAATPIYVQAPTPPSPAGNRAGGILIALIATVAYAVLFAIAAFVISGLTSVTIEQAVTTFSDFVVRPVFFIPVIFFFIAFALLIAIVNRGGWWAYVLFSFLIAVIVYFSYIGGALLTVQAWTMTPTEAAHFIGTQWLNPGAIAAAVIAREVPIWFGAWIAARGRKVTARNIEARQEYDRLIDEGPQLTSPF
ncbi:hypothetical protein GCM10022381_41680 [Leifsonia kafniensis]|uniref:Uncharacterized protein n=1 Tax=Leifsonia kafniensis TaxID=475957 RepID=A0ABP7LAF9_9MICO